MARRIGDPSLVWWALHTAWKALWSPAHAETRLRLAEDGLAATRAAGDLDSEAVALVVLTGTVLEMGDRLAYESTAREAEQLARRRRNSYVLMAMTWLQLSLAAMRPDPAETSRLADALYEFRPRLNPTMEGLHIAGIQLVSSLWTEQIAALVEPLTDARRVADNDLASDVLLLALARVDDVDGVRRELATPIEHHVETWDSATTWCCLAEAAAVAEDRALAERMSERLLPLSGRIAISGISSVLGPVDGYLALGLAASGRPAEAAAAADRAAAQADEWRLPAYSAWLAGRRDRLDF